ncbi:MAG: hypothetical protein ACOVNU_05890 [Candidatus Kapaibacteriota bacterium]
MKSIYSPEELALFLEKLKREIEADYVIMEATKPPSESIMNFQDALNAVHLIGLKQGSLEGRMNVVNKLMDFFEL